MSIDAFGGGGQRSHTGRVQVETSCVTDDVAKARIGGPAYEADALVGTPVFWWATYAEQGGYDYATVGTGGLAVASGPAAEQRSKHRDAFMYHADIDPLTVRSQYFEGPPASHQAHQPESTQRPGGQEQSCLDGLPEQFTSSFGMLPSEVQDFLRHGFHSPAELTLPWIDFMQGTGEPTQQRMVVALFGPDGASIVYAERRSVMPVYDPAQATKTLDPIPWKVWGSCFWRSTSPPRGSDAGWWTF